MDTPVLSKPSKLDNRSSLKRSSTSEPFLIGNGPLSHWKPPATNSTA